MIFFFLIQSTYAEVFKTDDKNAFNSKIYELEKAQVKFKTRAINKGKSEYLLLLQDSKKYKNARFRRNRKITHKGKLYYLQFNTSSKESIIKARRIFLKKGFKANHIKVLLRSEQKTRYEIVYENPKNESWFKSLDYSRAQSKLRTETQTLNNDYSSHFVDLLSGVELISDKYNGKIMGRFSYISEANENESFDDIVVEFDETYLKSELGKGQITVGKQLFSWGVFDEFSNFDRVNIKNLTRFIFDSGESFRRPVTAIRYEYYLSNWKFDSFYNFGFERGRMLNEDSIWFGVDREVGIIRGGDTSLINPNLIRFVNIKNNKNIDSGHGFRLSHADTGDFSFTYLRSYADLPILEFSSELRSEILANSVTLAGLSQGVELLYVNEDVVGIDYVRSLGDQLYKVEISYIPNSPVVNEELALVNVSKARVAIGGDIEVNLFASTIVWQALHEEVISSEKLFLDDKLTQLIVQSSSRFRADKLETGLRYILNLNDNSSYLSPFVNYDINDFNILGLAYHYFEGEDDSFYGYHREHSNLALKYSYTF